MLGEDHNELLFRWINFHRQHAIYSNTVNLVNSMLRLSNKCTVNLNMVIFEEMANSKQFRGMSLKFL